MLITSLLDGKNNHLFEQITARIEVILEENPDWRVEVWDSIIRDGKAIILHCPVPSPQASFAKELLRIRAWLTGFRPVVYGQSLSPQVNQRMQTIIKSLNHHFLNQKIAPEFSVLRYAAAQFQDDDGGTASFLKDQLQREDHSRLMLSLMYLSFIEPQLPIPEVDRQTIQTLFRQYDGGKLQPDFERIDKIMKAWSLDKSYDAEQYMVDFLTNTGMADTWLSYKTDSEKNITPKNGFFIGEPFGLD